MYRASVRGAGGVVTLNEIQLAIYRRCNYDDLPSPDVVRRILQWINVWHQRILAKPGLDTLRDTTLTFSSVIGQSLYALPQGLTRIETVFEQTSPRVLRNGSVNWIREYDPQLLATGVPEVYAIQTASQVLLNTAASGVWAVSTSAADTSQIAHIEGLRTGGYRTGDQQVLLTGTVRVQLGTYTDVIEVDKAYLTATAVGEVSFFDAAVAGNELARITIGQKAMKVWTIQLWPRPTTAILYSVDCKRVVEELVNATDTPTLPAEYHWLLVEAGSFEEWTRKDDNRAKVAMSELNDGIRDMRNWVTNLPDYKPRSGERFDRPSRLGGQYPAW